MANPKSVLEMAKKAGAKMVDIKFVDTFGTWQHFSLPISELTEEVFAEGLGFDGSSIRGWKSIEASDMLAMPDPETAFIDPFMADSTLSLTCTIAETGTKEAYSRDPRGIAQRARSISKPPASPTRRYSVRRRNSSSSTTCSLTPRHNGTFYQVDSEEAVWNTGKGGGCCEPNLGYKIRNKEGYFPVAPCGHPAGHPHGNVPGHGITRRQDRAPAPRSGHRRPGGN